MVYKIIILSLINTYAMIQDQNTLEKKVWEIEAVYWNSIKSKDLEKYGSLLHPKFSDWPGFLDKPVLSANTLVEIVKELQSSVSKFDFSLDPRGISVINESEVIVYFNCKISITNQQNEVNEHTHRMIHIWAKHENQWLLLGGLQTP